MPLPDERPRQSVANLIGRFEQQNKRQSSSAVSSIPRSSSVSSQIASDPAKEETKDKRELPPKSVASASTDINVLTLSSPSPSALSKSPAMSPQPITEKPAETIPASTEPVRSTAVQKQAAGKATPSPGSRINPTSPAKLRPSTASVKSPAKSPPKSSLSSSISQPLKPQHTGQSVNSNASTVRSPPKSAPKSVPRSTPSTPSRPKTPAMHASRPKTPSSGLFAPTAASLARSRNALPPAPPPVKKATLSSSAAERLSKPTAASMSKARTPAPTASPIRAVKSSAGSTPRGPSKLRVGLAPERVKEAKAQQPASAINHVAHEPDQLESAHYENGHNPQEAVVSEGVIDLHGEVHDHGDEVPAVEEVVESVVEVSPNPIAPHIEVPVNAMVVDDVPQVAEPEVHVEALVEESLADVSVDSNGSLESQEVTHATEEIAHDAVSEPLAVENDIEDMVTMLESVSISKSRPQSIVSIPDEHGEIPDEEQS